ncbi:MAG: CotH kinase family protein, partial [Flavobacteriales bacterium]
MSEPKNLRNRFKALLCGMFVGCSLSVVNAQEYVPALGPAFLADEVATVRLTLDEADLDFILHPDNAYSNVEWPGTFVYESSLGVDTVDNVGIRLRGNTSRTSAKKSFKVSFNTFTPGAKWNALEKLNLNGEHNDPSILRARMSWEFMRAQGLVAPRVSHVRLYINDEYKGLYLNVEHVDEEFLQKRFKHDHGNLWKCTYPANLDNLGSDPEAYKFTPPWNSEQRAYELKTNLAADDYSAIRDLCWTLGTASDSEFECAIEAVLDVDAFLRLAAMEILLGHWDNYIGNQNNYYLYQRP